MHLYSNYLSSLAQSHRQQSHQVIVQFQKHTHFQIFRQSVSAASCKPSSYREHAFHIGLRCWRSYQVLSQWGKQWICCLPSAPEGDGIFFWQSCSGPKFFSNVYNHFRFKIISFSFQLLLRFVRSDFRLYFVSVLRNISVSVFVSVNDIISISVSVNEYITGL